MIAMSPGAFVSIGLTLIVLAWLYAKIVKWYYRDQGE